MVCLGSLNTVRTQCHAVCVSSEDKASVVGR